MPKFVKIIRILYARGVSEKVYFFGNFFFYTANQLTFLLNSAMIIAKYSLKGVFTPWQCTLTQGFLPKAKT